MKALLSIKPQFVAKIFSGEKKYEYRKSIFAREGITTIIVYCTSPVCRIVGEFSIKEIVQSTPSDIWSKTQRYSGVDKEFYDEYFEGRNRAYAIRISKPKLYELPINPYEEVGFVAPQSFKYI